MKPNSNYFSVRFFMGHYSIYYLNYYICDLTSNVKEFATKEAKMMIDYEMKNWPSSTYYKKICEIHEEIINKHAVRNNNRHHNATGIHHRPGYYSLFMQEVV